MSTSATDARLTIAPERRLTAIQLQAQRLVRAQLCRISSGAIVLHDDHRSHRFGEAVEAGSLTASVRVLDPEFYTAVAFGGSVGSGESYAAGDWTTDDLTALVRVMVRNSDVLDGMEKGFARLMAPLRRGLHWLNRNTRAGSRRNIVSHYDLGNDFFALFLDESMTYSAAVFEHPGQSLRDAQVTKIDRICRKLALQPSDHLLEIGSGWGALAIHAAREYGCKVTTTTISPAQHALALARIRNAGVADRVELLLTDYRDLHGQYDKLVSIEMIEAVGHQFYDTYFGQVGRLLKPDGMALIQAITIADQRYEAARRSVDFIQRHIFPGSTIPSVTAMTQSYTRASDLRLFHLEDIGPHYATTLRRWSERFHAQRHRIHALGYPESFCRLWDFYFSYCEGGFAERVLGNAQMLLVKPRNQRAPLSDVIV
jgi:cyclopropane-fatty-acyl-phospholipid synthase